MTLQNASDVFDAVTNLMRQGWSFADAAKVLGYRAPTRADAANVSRLSDALGGRVSADRTYAHLIQRYPDADADELSDLVGTIATMTADRSNYLAVDSMISTQELHLAQALLDQGYGPDEICEASEDLSLHSVLEVAGLGLTPTLLARLNRQRRRTTSMSTVVSLVTDGLPVELLERHDVDTIVKATQLGLAYDDIEWLDRKGINPSRIDNWWSGADVFADSNAELRRLLVAMTVTLNDDPNLLRPIAAAVAGQPWADTLLTLLLDADGSRDLVDLIVTARALESTAERTPVSRADWIPVEFNTATRRTITRVSELTAKETSTRAALRKDGIAPDWSTLSYWLETGMTIEQASHVAAWVGINSAEWSQPVSELTGLNPLPDEPAASAWLAAALNYGHSLETIRLLASAYHADGPVGPHVASRVLGLGIDVDTANAWAALRLDIDTAAILTAYGITGEHRHRIAAQPRELREHATLMAAMGLDGTQLLTALTVITHWHRRTGSDLTTSDPQPVGADIIELLAKHQVTTTELVNHSILEHILTGNLDLATRDLALQLHVKVGRHVDNYMLSSLMTAYAAAISGTSYARKLVDGTKPPASRQEADINKAMARLSARTTRAREHGDAGRAVTVTANRTGRAASRSRNA